MKKKTVKSRNQTKQNRQKNVKRRPQKTLKKTRPSLNNFAKNDSKTNTSST